MWFFQKTSAFKWWILNLGSIVNLLFLTRFQKLSQKIVLSYTDLKTCCTSRNHHAGNEDNRTTLQQMSDFGISC